MSIVVALVDSVVSNGTRQPTVLRKGEAWSADDPVVRAHPGLFSADPGKARASERPVEQATRAPGEKSRARRVK